MSLPEISQKSNIALLMEQEQIPLYYQVEIGLAATNACNILLQSFSLVANHSGDRLDLILKKKATHRALTAMSLAVIQVYKTFSFLKRDYYVPISDCEFDECLRSLISTVQRKNNLLSNQLSKTLYCDPIEEFFEEDHLESIIDSVKNAFFLARFKQQYNLA
jgi:hypothetical protein